MSSRQETQYLEAVLLQYCVTLHGSVHIRGANHRNLHLAHRLEEPLVSPRSVCLFHASQAVIDTYGLSLLKVFI